MKSYLNYKVPIKNLDGLPKYPIPDKVEVFMSFLDWIEPLIDERSFNYTKNIVNDFLKSDDLEKLHNKLIDLGSREDDSWVYDYWVKFHLRVRDPLVPYTNVPIVYENERIKNLSNLEKAAMLICSVAQIYLDFRENPPSSYDIGGKIYSTDQFHGVLASMNEIKVKSDKYYINNEISDNVVLIYMNNIYSIKVIDGNQVCKYKEILNSVEEIYSAEKTILESNINFVTAEPNRDLAGGYLEEILKNEENIINYRKIKDSIFVLNLDENIPDSIISELYMTCLDIKNFNRWHGKGLEFSISKNGVLSFIVDHSFCDGGTEVYLVELINRYLEKLDMNHCYGKATYEKLNFIIDNEMEDKLKKSFDDYKLKMDCYTARYVEFDYLSRSKLNELGILSGDGFFHLALQAAQKMTYNKIYNTYIPVDMRKYFRGRTDVNRPITKESLQFVDLFLKHNENTHNLRGNMMSALNKHYERTTACRNGMGVNRYLYVLENIYYDYGEDLNIKSIPEFFKSDAYEIMNYNRLSTTSFGHKDIKYVYFPPVVKNGFGIYYMIGETSFMIITSFNEDVDVLEDFNSNLKYCIKRMLEIAKK